MIKNKLLNRQIDVGKNLNSTYYSNKIIKNYYDSTDYLYRYEVNIPQIYSDHTIEELSFSSDGNYMISSNLKNMLFWNLKESYSFPTPKNIKSNCKNIFKLCFNNDSSKIIYTENNYHSSGYNMHLVDVNSTATEKSVFTKTTVKNLSVNPINPDAILFSDFRKKIFSYDFRCSRINNIKIKNFQLKSLTSTLEYHPQDENLILVSTDSDYELFTFDLRNRQIVSIYKLPYYNYNVVDNARFNRKGTQILVAKRGVGPILFNINESLPAFEFNETGYYSTDFNNYYCFAGIDDEYIVSGSYNFDIFMWEIPKKNSTKDYEVLLKRVNKAKFVLKGHISVANKVYYNHSKSILASIGDNKLMFWSCLPLYSELKNYETIPTTNISQEIDPKYLPYLEDEAIDILKFFFLEDEFPFITENQFYYGLKNISDLKPSNLEKSFEKNLSIRFIYLFLIDFKLKRRFENSDLLKSLKDLLDNCSEDIFKGNRRRWNLLIESKKVFETKLVIMNCIEFLNFNIRLFILTKEKLIFIDHLKKRELRKFKSLEKLILIMKAFLYDLIIILKMSKELYEVSYEIIKKFVEKLGYECNSDTLGFDFSRSIYKKDSDKNNDESIDIQKKFLFADIEENDESIDDESTMSASTQENEESIESIDISKINLNAVAEENQENISFSNNKNPDLINLNPELNLCDDYSTSTADESETSNIDLTKYKKILTDDLKYIHKYTYSRKSQESVFKNKIFSKKKKNNDKNVSEEILKFCCKLNKNKSLKLFKQYNDDLLLKLSNDFEFEQKFKKEFKSLKKIEIKNLIDYYTKISI